LEVTSKKVLGGEYQITWSAQIYKTQGQGECHLRVLAEANTVPPTIKIGEALTMDGDTPQSVSGVIYEDFNDGDEISIYVQFAMVGSNSTAAIKRVYVGIVRVGD
jgi:hypothetical protein